ncbi:response regulator transcription factor [Pelodictyon luteolum]|uniref:Two component transcriptional regulator, LuxR family n=1 Tax=Chlorobium luteolum (strain DSM 273 / BCRC 81028 / 2530) TaxID=319225 RepID=Q3B2M4_CHLL3|nr:response regulator transcription factor [Pelodictyon luteolum]ABB24407.1 two component transcriptional regulator, LuxR family [Pelodictyon luteolum DSM 273]
MKPKGSILIADTQFLTTEALRSMLDAEGYGMSVVHTRTELYEYLKANEPSLIITDYILFDFRSINDLRELGELHDGSPILVLCNSVNQMQIKELNQAGIRNIALKTDDRTELLQSVTTAMKGKKAYSGSVLDILLKEDGPAEDACLLTTSEIEIVRLISTGLTTKEIAVKKHVSFHTVTTHRKNIFRKLGVSSSPELMMFAIKAGLIYNIEYHI